MNKTKRPLAKEARMYKIISWWENLTGKERSKFLNGRTWEQIGDVTERHKALTDFYTQAIKDI